MDDTNRYDYICNMSLVGFWKMCYKFNVVSWGQG